MRHTMNTADGQEFMDLSIHLSTYFAICNNELSLLKTASQSVCLHSACSADRQARQEDESRHNIKFLLWNFLEIFAKQCGI